jgi:hypothetical protein
VQLTLLDHVTDPRLDEPAAAMALTSYRCDGQGQGDTPDKEFSRGQACPDPAAPVVPRFRAHTPSDPP